MKTITVVTEAAGPEAIYVDGHLVFSDETVYASDIAEFAGDDPIILKNAICDFRDVDCFEWPEKLEDLPILEGL